MVEVYRRTLQIVECFFGLVPACKLWHHVVNTPFNHVMVDVDEYDEEAEIQKSTVSIHRMSRVCLDTVNAKMCSRLRDLAANMMQVVGGWRSF